jgi:hypothetical protein
VRLTDVVVNMLCSVAKSSKGQSVCLGRVRGNSKNNTGSLLFGSFPGLY